MNLSHDNTQVPETIKHPSLFASVRRFFTSRPTIGDLIAGVSVALILIPQSIAYASIAGLPPEVGLFASTIPLMVAAPLVCCPWLQTGPTAMTSLLTFGALVTTQFEKPEEMIACASMLALIVGATRFLLGIRRLGGFTKLLTRPVILGFTTGAAILIIASQLPKTLGIDAVDTKNVLLSAAQALSTPSKWSIETLVIASATGVFVLFGRRIHRLFPGIFLAMIVTIVYSVLRQYEGHTVGTLPGGFISLNFEFPWHHLGSLLFPGIVLAFVGFAEPAAISMALMEEEKKEWNPNQELCGGGLANFFSGLVGGYPIGGSFSRTSVNKFAGADTSWSGFVTGAMILSMLWLTPYLKDLPTAAIGAVVIVAVFRLIKFKEIWLELGQNRLNGTIAIITLVATLASAPRVDLGIAIGAILGIGVTIWEKSTVNAEEVVKDGDD